MSFHSSVALDDMAMKRGKRRTETCKLQAQIPEYRMLSSFGMVLKCNGRCEKKMGNLELTVWRDGVI